MADDLDDVWDKLGGPGDGPEDDASRDDALHAQVGPPIRVTFVLRSDRVPVAPWAQGWRVGAIGPQDGHVTLVCEHDMDVSPVAQLSAITGILGTVKQAQLDVAWWAIQTRGPLGDGEPEDLDAELSQMVDDEAAGGSAD